MPLDSTVTADYTSIHIISITHILPRDTVQQINNIYNQQNTNIVKDHVDSIVPSSLSDL